MLPFPKQEKLIFKDITLLDEINRYGRLKTVGKDEVLINPGDDIVFIPIVLSGCIRIIRQDEEGREVFFISPISGSNLCYVANLLPSR